VAALAAVGLHAASAVILRHAYDLPRADGARVFLLAGLGLALTLLPYALWLAPPPASPSRGGALALAAVALYVAGELGVYLAAARGPASIVNPLSGLYPIPTIAYGALVLGERPGGLGWLGMALALPGIVLVVPAVDNPLSRFLSRRQGVRTPEDG
jgi:drug/metabolite transporter (DMT)-like permease